MEKKIIYIHSREYPYTKSFYELESDEYYFFGQGPLYISQYGNDKYVFDVCRNEVGIKKIKEKIVNGARCLIFPGIYIRKLDTISISLIKYLYQEVRKNKKLIIHYTASPHKFEFYLIAYLFGKKVPVFVTHQGGANPYWKWKKFKKISSLFAFYIEKFISKYVSYYFSGSLEEVKYFKDKLKVRNVYIDPHWGVDIEIYQPISKNFARNYLNLELNKKYILLFGKLNKYRGIKKAVAVRDLLRAKYDVEILNIGSDETCPDYTFAKEKGVILKGYVPINEVKYYYSAGDVYLYLTEGEDNELFAGTGIAPLEALACNIPVVTNTLHNYPQLNLNRYGVYVKTIEEAVAAIDKIWSNEIKLLNGRELIEQYFTWKKITSNVFNLYEKSLKDLNNY